MSVRTQSSFEPPWSQQVQAQALMQAKEAQNPQCLGAGAKKILVLLHTDHEGCREVAAPRCIFKQGNLV